MMIFTIALFSPFFPTIFAYNNGVKLPAQLILSSQSRSVDQIDRFTRKQKVEILRSIITNNSSLAVMPCCYDGLSAKLVEAAGFKLTFMSGFAVSAAYGLPDTGLLSVTEMAYQANMICNALRYIPCIGDGDTGYGNVANVKRTVRQYINAGLSGIMIEDQVSPKRCGHTKGKQVVGREEACARIRAAVDARQEGGEDLVILARTDARGPLGLEEALERCRLFRALGADWTFLEAPLSLQEMARACREVGGPKMANMLGSGLTPLQAPEALRALGFSVAAYPLVLLTASCKAMQDSLEGLAKGSEGPEQLSFELLQDLVGFTEYYREMDRYGLQ